MFVAPPTGSVPEILNLRLAKRDVEFEHDMTLLRFMYKEIHRFVDDTSGSIYDLALDDTGRAIWGGKVQEGKTGVTNPMTLQPCKSGWITN